MTINGEGKEMARFISGFEFGDDTDTSGSCSIVWRGKMHLFGGNYHRRQISVVDKCQLTRIGNLTFDMYLGACAQRDGEEVFICFGTYTDPAETRKCRRAIGQLQSFTDIPNSAHNHGLSRIAVTSGKSLLKQYYKEGKVFSWDNKSNNSLYTV